MRFKPRARPESVAEPVADNLPPKLAEAVDQAQLFERAAGDDHHRVAVQMPGQNAFMHEGQDETAAKLEASMAVGREHAKEAAKRLDGRIRQMVQASRRERRSAAAWVNRF